MKKDLKTILRQRGIRALLTALPVVLMVVLPIVYSVAVSLLPMEENAQLPETFRYLLPSDAGITPRQFWMYVFTTLLCPMLFLSVPIICAVASASCAFVSEKANSTLETLLLSSMNPKSVFSAKITACALVSIAISLLSFFAFSITMTVADLLVGAPFFFSFDWLITVLLLMPTLALFSVVFVSFILMRVHSVGESLQTAGYLLLPFMVIYLAQFAGAFRITILLLVILAVLLAVLSIVFFNFSARKFQAESLTVRPVDGEFGASLLDR